MNVQDFVVLDSHLKTKFAIGMDEMHLLSFIVINWDANEVTITKLLDEYKNASLATTHKRLSNLIKQKLLTKTISKEDTRVKTLGKGAKYDALVKYLEGV
jgi:hypothetical protein